MTRVREIVGYFYGRVFRGKSAAWSAAFACALVVFSYLLYKVADKTNETNQRINRATLSLIGIQPGVKVVPPDGKAVTAIQVFAVWENGGSTPSREAITRINYQPWDIPFPKNYSFPDLIETPDVPIGIGPRGRISVPMYIGIDDFLGVQKGKHLYIWGWAGYYDVFPHSPRHLTEFCAEVVNVNGTQGKQITDPTGEVSFLSTACSEHNCYDEDCKDYNEKIQVEARKP